MNRSALVIKMLNYLYANGRRNPVSREELATILETSTRNVLEFKKELEIAGYSIESIRGKDGGYILAEKGIFPSLSLNDKEKDAIDKVVNYLNKQSNFDELDAFTSAMNKLKARINHHENEQSTSTIYLEESRKRLNDVEKNMLNLLQEAKNIQYEVEFKYSTNVLNAFSWRKIRPYEIIVNHEGYYVLGEDITPKKEHKIKLFKITEERMQMVRKSKKRFMKDSEFRLSEYIGEYSLMKDVHEVKLKLTGISARLVNEQNIENMVEKYWDENDLYIHFIMEGKYRVKNFILSLGSECEVLWPSEMKEYIYDELNKTLMLYKKSTA